MLSFLVLVSANGPEHSSLHIPYLSSPTNVEGKPLPVESANPWKASSQLTGNDDFLNRIKNMYSGDATQAEGNNVNLALQQQYANTLNALSDEIAGEAADVKAAQDSQRENEQGIIAEGDALVQVHTQEQAQATLYNAAASVANQLLLSEHSWQSSLGQAGKVEAFVAGDNNDVIHVLDGGATVLDAAKQQLDNLQEDALSRADKLKEECQGPLFDWNFDATKQANEQTHGLVDLLERSDRLMVDFDKAHAKIVEMIQVLASEQKEVSGTTAGGQTTSLLQTRAKAALAHPILPLKGQSLEHIGFWSKLGVLKDLFEHKYEDEVLAPIAMIQKKFHDA